MNPTDITNLSAEEKVRFQENLDKGMTPTSSLSAITSETLSGGTTPVKLPEIPTSTVASGLSAYATSVGEQEKERAKLQAEVDAKAQEAQTNVTKEKGRLQSLVDNALGLISGRGEAEKAAGLDVKAQKVTEYTNQLEALDRAEINEQRALQSANMTDAGRASASRDIARKYAFQKADVALLQSAANRDYETAFNIVNRKIELALEPIKFQLDYTKQFYEDAKADLTKAENNAFNLKISELDRQYEETKALEKYKGDIALTAVQNGVALPAYVQSEINGAKNQAEVNQILAKNGINLQSTSQRLQEQKLRLEIEKARIDLKDTIALGTVATGEYGTVINSASNLLGAEKSKQSRKDIASAIANGDYVTAYANVANNVEQALTGEVKTRFANQRNDYSAMLGLRTAIKEYADGGGNMGLLVGKEEEIKRKLGIDSGKASTLAVQLWREFQTYRNVMTGAAFTAQESKDYASVNPTLGKSLNLNLSVIDGSLNQLENRIITTVETRVPGAKKIYEKVDPESSMTDDEAYQLYLEAIKTP